MRRAARWDGWLPNYAPVGATERLEFTPDLLRAGVDWIRAHRAEAGLTMDGYDIVMEGSTSADDPRGAAATVRPWADAGATWWLDATWGLEPGRVREESERRLRAGPPTLD
jgi:hypothetical protein